MRRLLPLIFGLLAAVCAIPLSAQVVGLQPYPQALYYWNTSTLAWTACPNTSTLEPSANLPQAVAEFGLNASLNQWTPFTSCPNSSGGMVYPGAGVPVSTGTAWATSYQVQGTDTKLLSSGTISGSAGTLLCLSGNGGATTAGCSTPTTLTLEHNGTALSDQTLLNFNDTTPSAPSGSTNVTFQSDSEGDLSGYVPSLSGSLAMYPAQQGSGQYVLIYPGSYTCSPGADATCDWTDFQLPSYVNASDVTAVYAFAISSSNLYLRTLEYFAPNPDHSPGYQFGLVPGGTSRRDWPASQGGNEIPVPSDYATVDLHLETCCSGAGNVNVYSIGLEIDYTGPAPPAETGIEVEPPLTYASGTLGVGPNWPNQLFVNTVATLPAIGSAYTAALIYDGVSPTDCSTGGGSYVVLCYTNGSGGSDSYTGYSVAGGVPTVNGNPGPLVMSFSTGAGSCTSSSGTTTCSFTGSGSGGGSVTNFIASSGSWPSMLVPSVATSTTTPTLSVSLATQSANTGFFGPSSGSAAAPTFRSMVTADLPTGIPYANLAALSANQVLGALTATTPGGLTMPSCSTGSSALTWTSGTGFGCNTFSLTPPGGTTGQLQYNNGGSFGGFTMSGDATLVPSTGVITVTKSNGTAFGTAAFATLGNTGSDVPQLSSGLLNNSVVNWAAPSAIGSGTPNSAVFTTLKATSVAGAGTYCVQVDASGNFSNTGQACGSGGSSGTVSSGTGGQFTWYASSGTVVSGNAHLTDSGSVITSTEQLAVNDTADPSEIALTPTSFTPTVVAGATSLAAPATVTTAGTYILPQAPGSGAVIGTNAAGLVSLSFEAINGAGAGLTSGPSSTTTNDCAKFTGSAGQLADAGVPCGVGTVNAGTANQLAYFATSTNAVSGTSAIPNGITATTQSTGDNTTKVATDAFVLANAALVGSANTFTAANTFQGGLAFSKNASTGFSPVLDTGTIFGGSGEKPYWYLDQNTGTEPNWYSNYPNGVVFGINMPSGFGGGSGGFFSFYVNGTLEFTVDSSGDLGAAGDVYVGNGTAGLVYRCTTAGALPVGALTLNTSSCGASASTGLLVK